MLSAKDDLWWIVWLLPWPLPLLLLPKFRLELELEALFVGVSYIADSDISAVLLFAR